MVFEFIKKYFTIKTSTLEKFIELVDNQKGVSVTAKLNIISKNGSLTVTVGTIADYEYSTRFISETPAGRLIVFNEVHGSRFGSEYGFADAGDRGRYALKGLLTADDRLQKIKARLPNVETALLCLGGKMDETTRQKMYKDSAKYNITPF